MIFCFMGEYPDEITEVDFKDIDKICELKRDDGSCFLGMNLRDVPSTICAINGTIEDMVEEIYDHGFEDGMHKEAENHFLFQKKMQEGTTNVKILHEDLLESKTSTADIEVASDEDEPILPKGWFEIIFNSKDIEDKPIVLKRSIKAGEVIYIREDYHTIYESFVVEIALRDHHFCLTTESHEEVMKKYMKALEELK